jgi:diguanylate cyclase (GGDEF)-like protein/PAS domain S-box-containing protein
MTPSTSPDHAARPRANGADPFAGVDVFEQSVLGSVITDAGGHFRRVNQQFATLVGRARADLMGKPFSSLTSPDDIGPSVAVMKALLSKNVETASFDKHYVRPDGTMVAVEMHIRALENDEGEIAGFFTQAVDVGDRERAEAAAGSERRRLEDAQRIAGLGSFEHDLAAAVIRPSREMCRLLGVSVSECFELTTILERCHPDDRPMVVAATTACVEQGAPLDLVHRLVWPDGTIRWVHARATQTVGDDGRGLLVGTALDITERKKTEDDLEFQMFHDRLTGLANRTRFLDRLDVALHSNERRSGPIAVLLVDVDDFKTVNDALGHAVGDELLVAMARRFESVLRQVDTLARLGGDEFALLIASGSMPGTAENVAARIASQLASPFHIGETEVTVTVSIGIAVVEPARHGSDDLLRDADLAMYLAKQNGKGRVEIAHPRMQDEALRHFAAVRDLRRAPSGGELEVFYQALVNVGDAKPAGAEALIRWNHPDRGLVYPSEFIGIAESTGLIVPIGDWVLNEACRQTQVWRRDGTVDDDFYVSVNLSPRQLAEPTLVDDVVRALRDSGLPPRVLVLEITESTLMLDFDAGLARLRALKDLGLRIALDDYGTGYSSLNRLGKLPVDIVKIDKTFIDEVTVSREGRALVQSVIEVAKAFGMRSIAEGVERSDQRVALAELGCDYIQGYLFAKPTPPAQTADTLRDLAAGCTVGSGTTRALVRRDVSPVLP